jgi:hypothetical protein
MKTNIDGGSNAIFLFLLSKIFLNQLWIMLVSRYNFTYLHYKFEIKKEKYGLCSQKRVYFAFSFDRFLNLTNLLSYQERLYVVFSFHLKNLNTEK